MLKLNKMTDYAVVALLHLWQFSPKRKTVAEVSLETGLPETTVAKILKKLSAGSLLQSVRGAGGGYFADRGLGENTSIWRVIEVMEGPIALTACVDEGDVKECCIMGACPLQGRWGRVNKEIYMALDKIKLADMQAEEKTEKVAGYGG